MKKEKDKKIRLENLITNYSSREENYLRNFFKKNKTQQIIPILEDLLYKTINDKNSSGLRELVTASLAGYIHTSAKLGYDCYKETKITPKPIRQYAEIKPKNLYKINDSKKRIKKLNGQGNFTDLSWKRFDKIVQDQIKMLCSGFIEGQIIYILEFNFNEPTFLAKITKQLSKRFPNRQDVVGQWLRSANFSFKDYKDVRSLKILYLRKNFTKYKTQLSEVLLSYLQSK